MLVSCTIWNYHEINWKGECIIGFYYKNISYTIEIKRNWYFDVKYLNLNELAFKWMKAIKITIRKKTWKP